MASAAKQGEGFEELAEVGALEALVERSREAPVVLFKHSLTCPISAFAYGEMSRLAPDVAEATALIVVQRARAVSNEIAARTGVRHESPQAIILRNRTAVWSASHYDITAEAVEGEVRKRRQTAEGRQAAGAGGSNGSSNQSR